MAHSDDLLHDFHNALSCLRLAEKHALEEVAEMESCLRQFLGVTSPADSTDSELTRELESPGGSPVSDPREPALLKALVAASPSYVHLWCLDTRGTFIFANQTTASAFGLDQESIKGHQVDRLQTRRSEVSTTLDLEVLSTGRPSIGQVETILTSGAPRWIRTNRIPWKDETGNVIGLLGFGLDITELCQAEKSLDLSEIRAKALFENASDAILLHDLEGRFKEVNRVACERLGYTRTELLSMSLEQVLAPEFRSGLPEGLAKIKEQGYANLEVVHEARDGRRIDVQVSTWLIESEDGPRVLGIARDITEQKCAAETLQEANKFSHQIICSAQEGLIVYGLDLRYKVWNPFMEQLSGLPAREVLGKHPLELFPFLGEQGVIARLEKALAGEVADEISFPYQVPATGRSGWARDVGAPLRNAEGGIIGVIGIVTDITELKRTEEELRHLNVHLEDQVRTRTRELQQERDFSNSLIQENPAYFLALSSDGQILLMNDSMLKASGYSHEEVLGTDFLTTFVPPEDFETMLTMLEELDQNTASTMARVPIRSASGTVLMVDWHSHKACNPDGSLKYIAAIGIDVTDRQRQEKLLATRSLLLEALVSGDYNMQSLLEKLADHIQEIWPDHPVSLRVLDETDRRLHHALNRGLPEFYIAAVQDLALGPDVGCSAAAASTGKRIVAEDLQTHPNWTHFRELTGKAGLCACWSVPILSRKGLLLGTLAVYARQPERPTEGDLQTLDQVASLAVLLYEQGRFESDLALREAAIKATANAIVITDNKGVIQWVNPAFRDLTGYLPDELHGRNIRILKSDRQGRAFYKQLWDTITSGHVWRGEMVNRRKDGSEYIEAQTITPVPGKDGSIFHYVSIKQDVSELKNSEASIRKLSQAVEQAPNAVVITNTQGVIEYVNSHFTELSGYTPEEALGHTPNILKSGLTPETVYTEMWQSILSGQTWRGELLNKRKNGQLFWQKLAIAPILDNKGAISHFVANTEDITSHRLLEESRQRLSSALEQAADATAVLDKDGLVTFANPAFYKTLGLGEGTVLGEPVEKFLEDSQLPGRFDEIVSKAREGQPWMGRHTVQASDGTRIILDGTLSPVKDLEGNFSGSVAVFRNVTDEIEKGRQLIQAQKMESLGALAGGVSHDFNNILSAILTCAELIEWQLDPHSPIHSKLGIIYQVCQQARELTRQILSFSRLSKEKCIPFDLSTVIREVSRLLKTTLPKNVLLRQETLSSVWVSGDPSQIQQVVMNLAINGSQAIGAKNGSLTLSLDELELGEADGLPLPPGKYAKLCVRDTGSGMDAATLKKIFEPFFTTKPEGEGTGLGLSVVHGIVHSLGGHIKVESALGEGTTFWVYLPCTIAVLGVSDTAQLQAVYGTERILLVDDEDIVTALTKQGLEGLGYHVVAKTSPSDALEVFQAQPGAFDLLITDLNLPGFSGAELARRIRRIRPGMPAILVTGTNQTMETASNFSETFDETLAKPLMSKDLGAAIRRVIEARKFLDVMDEYPEAESLYDGGGRPSVLVADGSHATRSLLRNWMAKAGYRVQEAKDGQEAWELFLGSQGRSPFSIVLTDIILPRMDGFELIGRIRKAAPDIPIVILSSMEDAEIGKKAMQLHVNEFLTKPFDSNSLLAIIERLSTGGMSRTLKEQLEKTAQAVRLAHKVMEAIPEKDLPIYSICEPLMDAGGDVFRAIRRPDGHILFLLADVAGHSVMSSYAVASFLGMLSTFLQEDSDVTSLFQCLNRSIIEGPFPDIPIAMVAADWSPRTGRLHVINAGIPHGLWLRKVLHRTEAIPLDGAPLGLFDLPRTNEKVLVLEPGDRLFFASDGLLDVMSMEKVPFRDLALAQWQGLADVPIDQALGKLGEAGRLHGNGYIGDDLLAIALEQPAWKPHQTEFIRTISSTLDSVEETCADFESFFQQQTGALGLDKSRRFKILLAFREALSNAHHHGNKGEHRERIAIHASLEEEALNFRIVDAGRGFDLEMQRENPGASTESGRGIPILKSVATRMLMRAGELDFQVELKGGANDWGN